MNIEVKKSIYCESCLIRPKEKRVCQFCQRVLCNKCDKEDHICIDKHRLIINKIKENVKHCLNNLEEDPNYEIRRIWHPYCVHYSDSLKKYYFLNRNYKNLGNNSMHHIKYPDIGKVEVIHFYEGYPDAMEMILKRDKFIDEHNDYQDLSDVKYFDINPN